MFDWIPLPFYTHIYYHVLLLVNVFVFIHALRYKIDERANLKVMQITGVFVFAFVLLYMGLRPIHGVFVDMNTYERIVINYAKGNPITTTKDLMFHSFTWSLSHIISSKAFFFVCATLYIVPCYI